MKTKHNLSIIRPELHIEDVKLRRNSDSRRKSKTFKKALQTFHTLETMAVNIYKFQITKAPTELNRQLIAALCNEMTHLQDFQVKLYEYGFKPKKLRWIYWIVGFALGFVSRLKGTKAILKTGIWVEKKAVLHYKELLKTIEWDEETKRIIEKNQADEHGHISRWNKLLEDEN